MKFIQSIITGANKCKELLDQHLPRWIDFIQLARLDRPIGIYLLLWPTLWALWLAAEGTPTVHNLVVFILGAILTRSAGCVINDYADRHFDGQVKRTHQRPLVTRKITPKEALVFAACLFLVAFLLVLTTNTLTIYLSFAALLLASAYPFAKRHTYLPQVVLGAAFGWSIPMAFAAEIGTLTTQTWLLFTANLLWTVAYDTQYAMVDRDDDLQIGIKSTAILFGEMDNLLIGCFQTFTLIALLMIGLQLQLAWPFYLSLVVAAAGFIHQQWLTRNRERGPCFKAFLANHWVGAALFLGFACSL
ncbi:4-hydroxybenzoate octaprenyltransferase [Endozoicomonas sp. SCSIO W0465]|uniref:4-hydroxybenzoate octaprenyltransferase n=1 Tax=Endozoicomonas sp. SCSIO W0465 TaxID=2918516 RepID=UPI002076593E|nr:4-hydroxybenzoate octaprenyltransferase [Endozoicomonas sp. SCSIO W0465]USE35918.1 4-hydroxybenzoate octaprenyltransferase [Endozoicomonas sp. SCSIO W0465]